MTKYSARCPMCGEDRRKLPVKTEHRKFTVYLCERCDVDFKKGKKEQPTDSTNTDG